MNVRCIRCRCIFHWDKPKGGPPLRCAECRRLRRNKLERAGVKRRGARDWSADWARRKARAAAATAAVGHELGSAPLNYRPKVPSARCLHCRRSYATTRRAGRMVCADCLGKGLR